MNNEQRSSNTKNNILNAATVCFAGTGYNATGVAEICKQAGVSKGAFYYHFESKETVFLALVESWLFELENILENEFKNADNVAEAMLKLSGKIQDIIDNNPLLLNLFLELWTNASRNPRVHKATIEPYDRYKRIFETIVQKGIDEGTFNQVNPAVASQFLLSLTSGLFMQAILSPDSENWGESLRDSIILLLEGLKRRD